METIEDIVREMRKCAADCTSSGCRDMESFADRIDAAYRLNGQYQESKCAANEELARKLTKQREINKELVDENALLKAALRPVLKIDRKSVSFIECLKSIIYAQRICNWEA